MNLVNINQNTPEWHDWRAGRGAFALPDGGPRIMASEMPIVMGDSPYQTAHQLWKVKTGRARPQQTNAAMMRGHQYEDHFRKKAAEYLRAEFEPICVEADLFGAAPEWAAASLDGYSSSLDAVLEIKVPGAKVLDLAKRGILPDVYRAQVQWQLLVTGAESCIFLAGDPGDGVVSNEERMFVVYVQPDPEYQLLLIKKATEFRQAVMTDTPVVGDESARAGVRWLKAYAKKEAAEAEFAEAQKALLSLLPPDQTRLDLPGITLTRAKRSGTVDKDAVITLLAREFGVDPARVAAILDAHRGPSKDVESVRRSPDYETVLREYEAKLDAADDKPQAEPIDEDIRIVGELSW